MPSGKSSGGAGVKMPVVIIAVIALVGFMVWWGVKSFGPATEPRTEAANAHDEWLNKLVKDSGADWSKVSEEDKGKFNTETRGNGEMAFKAWAKDHPAK